MGHVKYMSAVAGLEDSHVFDLEDPAKLDARRKAAFPFARKLTREPEKVERADIEALRGAFTDPEIVQLTFAICHFNTMNRLADAFGVPLEDTNPFAAPKKDAKAGESKAADAKPTPTAPKAASSEPSKPPEAPAVKAPPPAEGADKVEKAP